MKPTPDLASRRTAFRQLHQSGCFVLPNPWDVGTARYLRHLGFKALATTSSGFAFTRGLPDADWAVPRDLALAHIAEIVAATELPVNADFESGYAHEPRAVGENVRLCVETGVAGLSIEDATGDRARPLYDLSLAVERIQAARSAIEASGSGVLLTARSECYLVGHPDPLAEATRRLQAFAAAGADVLYAPRPLTVLISADYGFTVADLAALGVRRISVGSALARAAWAGFIRAARALAGEGSFSGFSGSVTFNELNAFFRQDLPRRTHSEAGS